MMKRLVAALLFMVPSAAWATCSSVPYTFTPNTLAQSGQVNANFAAVVNCANTIDASQITTGVLPVARGGTNNPTWTTGSVVFATAPTQLGQDNANLFWDSTNHRLGVGTNTPTQALEVNGTGTFDGPVNSQGASAGVTVVDRSTSGQATFYRNAGITHLFDSTFADTISYDNAGHVSIDTTPNASFQLTVNGITNSGQYDIAGKILAEYDGTHILLFDASGDADIFLGGAGDQQNYYRNNVHLFQNVGGGTQYASINASTFAVNVATLTANAITGTTITASNTITATSTVTGSSHNCSGAANSQCVHSNFSGDSLNNYTNSVWGFYASGGTPAQLFSGQYSTQAPGTAGSTTACLVGGYYLAGMSGLTVCGSDERLKTIGDPLSDGLSLVDQLKPVNFTWKDGVEKHPRADEALHAGFVAQDVKRIMPQCVNTNPDKFYSLDSNCLIAYLAKAIQELDAKVSSK